MVDLGNYVRSVIFVVFLCGILSAILPDNSHKSWIHLLCGIILTIFLVKPFVGVSVMDLIPWDGTIQKEGESYTAEGKKMAQDAMAVIIIENAQSYIMDKAEALGITVAVEISVSDDAIPVPIAAELSGAVSPYARLQVEALIQRELGIAKENIRWIQ